ncbi:germination protein YpeB [Oceanobacillus piezotolerans]|uniref:Germination protein YpeB n=1 Tax=Oceanobacillus piezotolerans TaxID=2448030 RepID=A0A498DI31_9BACI|nr:germination protein YpeB [Oceanobacillus piezotolerans]RLL48189.1 germination protein YpeB [Oceanobacillus piezotolerans]
MIRWILIGILTLGIAGTAFWGYQEHQEKNAILTQAENTYQRSFHELSYYMDLLHDEIGTALAMNSDQRLSPQMVEIWRLTSEASSNVGQLPLGLLPFNKTEEFLSNIGDFTYRTAVRNLDDEPLTEEETKTLQQYYKQSSEIEQELREVQHLALENNLRWMDVQLALVNNEEQLDNTIIDGLKTVEDKVGGYSEANIDSSVIGISNQQNEPYKSITGKKVSEQEALNIAKDLFEVKDSDKLTIAESGKGADIPIYSVSYNGDDKHAYTDISQQGGKPLSLLINRQINENKISLNEGLKKAEEYVNRLGFDDMIFFRSSEYGNTGAYSFLSSQDGVRIYPDAIEVKVALDNGDIMGITADNYYRNHKERDIPEPKVTKEEAKEMVNPNVDIQEEYLAVIDNDLGEEVLTYEFLGTYGDDTYRIFINALNGMEEKVEKLGGTEINYAIN